MHIFIETTPKHRVNAPTYSKYSQYRELLKQDFYKRCAYCNDTHKYSIKSFAIDHFIPQKPKNFTTTILPNQYTNLIYCCSYCNRAKWNKWPTNDENIENDGYIGFVKPTDDNYKNLFFRNYNGRIIPHENNPLAIYIKNELMLWHPIHSLMWKVEKLMDLEEKVKSKLKATDIPELTEIHYEISKELINIYRDIFSTND